MFPKHIFRAYDIRGKYGEDLTEEIMEDIGKSLGTIMLERGMKSVVVGRDCRWTSPIMAAALKRGLLQTPVEVYDCGEASFGAAVYCAQGYEKDICAYVTPSHLPADYNGLKVFYGTGLSFMARDIKEIGERAEKKDWRLGAGEDKGMLDAKTRYLELLKNNFDCSGVKCVLDCGGGATVTSHPEAFRVVGIDVVELFCEKDPYLKVRNPKPKIDTVTDMIKKVIETGADLGVAYDADGDRAILVDDLGQGITPDEFAAIVGKRLLEKEKGIIVATVECSMLAEDFLGAMGAEIIRVPVGHTYIMEAGHRYNALLAYEDSGHIVMPRIALFDDPTFAIFSMIEAMKKEGKTSSELLAEIPKYPRKRKLIKVSEEDKKFGAVEKLKKKMSEQYSDVNTLDGVRINFNDAWVLMRASNTEPVVRLTVEATTEKRAEELADKFVKIIEEEVK